MNSHLSEILAPYKGQKGSLIPILQKVQEKEGYLPPEALEEIARFLRVPAAEVYGVATFYAQFRFTPVGKHMIKCCQGTACHVRGGRSVLDAVETDLGIKAGGTTADMKFSLEAVACFGSCGLAPVISVDEDFYGRLTTTKVRNILKEVKSAEDGQEK